MRHWTIRVTAPLDANRRPRWLSANDRMHWAPKAHLVRLWREQARYAALAAGIPKGLGPVRIDLTVHYPATSRRRDASNVLGPTGKALIDGLVDAGVLTDDNDHHITATTHRAGPPLDRPAITLTITEDTP